MLPRGITNKLIRNIVFILILWLPLTGIAYAKTPSARQLRADKVIVLVIDDLGIEDLRNEKLQNLKKIAESGIIGLMNTRTKSLGSQNRPAAYLTIGMGVRVQALRHQKETKALIDILKKQYPSYVPGKIGEIANKNGKRIALLGNSDTNIRHNFTLLAAMDSTGSVDSGDMDSKLLTAAPGTAWGIRTDSKRLLNSFKNAVKTNDIVFVDYGDTTRVAEAGKQLGLKGNTLEQTRNEAFQRADLFLGELIKIVDKQNAVLLVISPTSSVDNNFTGIKNLAPVFIYKKGTVKGVITSNTTRREGLISNIDIAPGIFEFLGIDTSEMQFTGEKMTVLASSNPVETIEMNYKSYAGLKKFRYIVHGYYVLLIALVLYLNFRLVIKNRQPVNRRFSRAVSVMIIAVPVISGITAIMLKDIVAAVVVFNILLLLTGYMFSANIKTAISGMTYISLATSGLIIFDLLTGVGYLFNTPLGFNDVFTGGRYYGINNDCMGILLGSVIFGLFNVLERLASGRFAQITIIAGVLFIVVLSQTPGFGANVGGTIAAIITGTLACIILVSGRRPAIKGIFLVVIAALAAELAVTFSDTLSGSQTHAGKTAAKLLNDNFIGQFIEIIGSKLSVFLAMLVIPPWNILFFGQIYFCWRVLQSHVGEIKNIEYNNQLIFKSFQIILYGAGAAFIFNDTGIIAAAMMLIYLTVPFGMLLVREGSDINEYGQAVTQRI